MHKDDLPRLKLSSIEQPVDRVVTGFTAPALRAKIDWKSAICKGVGQYPPKFHVEGDVPHQSFSHG